MDAWESLLSGATIPTGDAWELLEAQGGTGTETIIVHADGMEVEMATTEVALEIDQSEIDTAIDQAEISVEINQSPLEVGV